MPVPASLLSVLVLTSSLAVLCGALEAGCLPLLEDVLGVTYELPFAKPSAVKPEGGMLWGIGVGKGVRWTGFGLSRGKL